MEDLVKYEPTRYKSIEEFQKLLNKQPLKQEIKKNEYAGNSQYLPIGFIEKHLDESFAGLWSTTEPKIEIVANSVVCTITLKAFHPTAQVWIERGGVGAVPIQLNKGEKELNFVTIKSDAIRKNAPAAKSMAMRNAAQSLGRVFGRDLNREDVGDFMTLTEQVEVLNTDALEIIDLLAKSSLTDAVRQMIEKRLPNATAKEVTKIKAFILKNQAAPSNL